MSEIDQKVVHVVACPLRQVHRSKKHRGMTLSVGYVRVKARRAPWKRVERGSSGVLAVDDLAKLGVLAIAFVPRTAVA
jgi:hypothetical protein